MPTIKINGTGSEIFCQEGMTLLDCLQKADVPVDNPCSGKGLCGKCKVKVVEGQLPVMSKTEQQLLKVEEITAGVRLACLTIPEEDLVVEPMWTERKGKVMTSGYLPEFSFAAAASGYGVAVDIGTTTVVTVLVEIATGNELAYASAINAQKHLGLDVLTRITYEYENPDTGAAELKKAIVDSLNEMIGQMCSETGIKKEEITEIDVAANCTMLHMLLGVDARSIGRSPYQPSFLTAQSMPAAEAGIQIAPEGKLYCLPSVSAYIGADIVAGAYVCGLNKESRNVLFIDIGTNGEIILATGGRLLSCSCAAGPALEGMNISCGMRAAEGAIEDVTITETGVTLTTIGGQPPEGICGSGILAALKELLRTGLVKPDGAFMKPETLPAEDYRISLLRMDGKKREFMVCEEPEIIITQKDIRQVQLAKGAILSGFRALLDKAGIAMSDLDEVLIAGQFGAHLPGESLVGTGILPSEVGDRLKYVGNTSKTGAYMALMSETVKQEMEALANRIEYMELAESNDYEKLFVDCLIFQ